MYLTVTQRIINHIITTSNLKQIAILSSIIFSFVACNHTETPTYEKTEGGLLYLYRNQSESKLSPEDGNKLLLDVAYFDAKDSLLFRSRDISSRFIMDFMKPHDKGASIENAFAMMHEGDSMSFKLNAYYFYKHAGQTEMLEKTSKNDTLRFEVRLTKILSPEIVAKEVAELDEKRKDEEEALLADFIQHNYPEAKPTLTGLYYVETMPGEGPCPTRNSKVAIHYTAMYLNGEPIYSTYQKNDPLIFDVNDPNVWPCLAEAVQKMNKGCKATIIARSKLAAGEQGDKRLRIAPRKSIIFDIELVAFK